MEVKYILNNNEKEFIKSLYTKEQNVGEWTGMECDDEFNEIWKGQIRSFHDAGLVEKKDSGSGYEYWRYGLNIKGRKLISELFPELIGS